MSGTHKIQDRAEKYFMLVISKGWDENGAYRLTSEKFGTEIADQVFSKAKGIEQQIRRNPRMSVDELAEKFFTSVFEMKPKENKEFYKKWLNTFRSGEPEKYMGDKELKIYRSLYKEFLKNPRKFKNTNKIKIGKILDDDDGIEKTIIIEKGHPGRTNYRVFAEPTEKGKETMAYREMRAHLGDHWFSDITDSWFLPESGLSKKMQEKINKVVEEVKSEGYTRY